jgi:pimeloyl-ACP methyl ester carboxylesterase
MINKLIVEDVNPTKGSSLSLFHGYIQALQGLDLNKPRREILPDLEAVVTDLKVRQFLLTNLIADPSGPNRFKWKINLAGIENSLQHILGFKIESGNFDGPSLFIYGTKSDFVVEKDKPSIMQFFPNVTFQSLDTGHWLHAEDPLGFSNAVVEFLLRD